MTDNELTPAELADWEARRGQDAEARKRKEWDWSTHDGKLDLLLSKMDVLERTLAGPRQEWFSIEDVAVLTGLSNDHIRRAVTGGTLAASNMGTPDRPYYRISRKDIDSFMEKRKAGAYPPPGRTKAAKRTKPPLPVSEHFPRSVRSSAPAA